VIVLLKPPATAHEIDKKYSLFPIYWSDLFIILIVDDFARDDLLDAVSDLEQIAEDETKPGIIVDGGMASQANLDAKAHGERFASV